MSHPSRLYLSADAIGLRLPDGRQLFHQLSFGLGDERVGIVGANGSGKSTLLKLLVGALPPTSGSVRQHGPVGYVAQGARPASDAAVGDALGVGEILTAIARSDRGTATPADLERIGDAWDLPARTIAALGELGLDHLPLDRPVAAVSGGEATRLALAAQLLAAPQALVLDEPTNDLDAESRAAVYGLVSRWRHGLIVASHDRAVLADMDRIVELRNGAAKSYGGGYDAYRAQVEMERAAAARERDSAAAELTRTSRAVQEMRERKDRANARGKKSRTEGGVPKIILNTRRDNAQKSTGRVQDTLARVAEEAKERLTQASARVAERELLRIVLPTTGLPAGTMVMALQRVAVGPVPEVTILHDVSFEIVGPERLALTGPNGSGKTTLLRVLAGLQAPSAGSLYRGVPVAQVALLDQHVSLLGRARTIRDAFAAHHPTLDVTAARAALAQFQFRADAALQSVDTLSGGERMRAALACVLAGPATPRCLVLDEPTNHLDLDSIEQLEAALRAYDGALIVASHDETFLASIGIERRLPVSRWQVPAAN